MVPFPSAPGHDHSGLIRSLETNGFLMAVLYCQKKDSLRRIVALRPGEGFIALARSRNSCILTWQKRCPNEYKPHQFSALPATEGFTLNTGSTNLSKFRLAVKVKVFFTKFNLPRNPQSEKSMSPYSTKIVPRNLESLKKLFVPPWHASP